MPDTVTVEGPPAARGNATISASALAKHLDCSRAYIGKLEADGVIHGLERRRPAGHRRHLQLLPSLVQTLCIPCRWHRSGASAWARRTFFSASACA